MKEGSEFKFIYQFDEGSPRTEVSLPTDYTLNEVVEAFELFLHGAGYQFTGQLDFIEDEETNDVTN